MVKRESFAARIRVNKLSFEPIAGKIIRQCDSNASQICIRLPQADLSYQTILYGDLKKSILSFRSGLVAAGFKPGDRIILLFPLSFDLVALMVAAFAEGLVVVFIDTGMTPGHMLHSAKIVKAKGIISSQAILKKLRLLPYFWSLQKYAFDGSGLFIKDLEELRGSPKESPVYPAKEDDPALITFTSGTTGKPKAANRTHGILFFQHVGLNSALSIDDRHRVMHCFLLPYFIILLMVKRLRCLLLIYPCLVILIQPKSRVIYVSLISMFWGAPAFMERLMDHFAKQKKKGLWQAPKIKFIFVGGGSSFSTSSQENCSVVP